MGESVTLTGALLGRVVDSQTARDSGFMQASNRVTNKAETDRMFGKWAQKLVERVDDVNSR